ncbi:uncharacterized protein [Chelonus insularis]|nr:uncharacterized protein LOC118064166 isoform X2 [Chelonus insularis]
MVLKATLETEIKKKEQKLRDIKDQIETVKKSVELKYNEGKMMSKFLEIEKEKLKIFEPMLKVLSVICEDKKFELLFLEQELDSDSLRMKDEQQKYKGMIEKYKNIWESYRKKYEKLDGAVRRREIKIKVEKEKVKLMNLEFKRNQLIKMLEQREAINDMRLKALIKEMSQLVLERLKQQNYRDVLKADIIDLNKKYAEMCNKYKKIQQDIEEEAKAKALARQLMPAPRINTSMLRSVYSATPRSREKKVYQSKPMGSDTTSVCSSILDQLFSENEKVFDKINNDKKKEDVESLQQLDYCECSQNSDVDEQTSQNSQHELNVNTLENECRQLSINEEPMYEENNDKIEDSNNAESQQIVCEAIIEAPRLPVSTEAYLGPVSHLKKKPSENIDSAQDISEEPERKRSKLSESSRENLLLSNLEKEKNKTQDTIKKILPNIRKVEIINEPIKIQTKPPMAEVPPTPNLCPNRNYAPSSTSEDHLSIIGDGNYEIDTNWQNFSPPNRADSNISFMSNASMFKNMMYDSPAMPTHSSDIKMNNPIVKESNPMSSANQTIDPAPNFFSCFNSGKPSTQNYF